MSGERRKASTSPARRIGLRGRRLLELVERAVTGMSDRDLREMRNAELAAAWTERLGRLDRDVVVLVAPAPVERLDQLSYAIVADERRPSADLPDIDLDDWWDGFYGLSLELYVAMPVTRTYERAGELIAEPSSNAPGERRGLELASLYIDERAQGHGLGARLVRELIARARLRGVESISVAISPRAPGRTGALGRPSAGIWASRSTPKVGGVD